MEKVIVLVQRAGDGTADRDEWCVRLRGPVAARLLDSGLPGLTVNVKDADVRASLMTLTTLDPPVAAVVSLWTDQYYGEQVRSALEILNAECPNARDVSAYLVTESVPLPRADEPGSRTPGLANVALLRRPPEMDTQTWRTRWHVDHTPVAIETQATFGYTQNEVVRALTPGAPPLAAIVEELFPIEAVADLKAFFGASDDDELTRRVSRMIASTSSFGANENVDTVPTSRYVLRSPFA
jgi:EthD domain